MQMGKDQTCARLPRTPWNRGKLIGAKPPLQVRHVWAIRTHLQLAGRARDLALFNLAIDSKLRGCDVVRLRVGDVAPHGYAVDRATVRQQKTGRPVKFEITEQARQAETRPAGGNAPGGRERARRVERTGKRKMRPTSEKRTRRAEMRQRTGRRRKRAVQE